jgi:hypothetical protein
MIARIGSKILAGLFRIGNKSSPVAKGFDAVAKTGKGLPSPHPKKTQKGSSLSNPKKTQKGGFIFTISAIIGAISAAASAAAAAASTVGAISVAGTTVGALTAAGATAAASTAGGLAVKEAVSKIKYDDQQRRKKKKGKKGKGMVIKGKNIKKLAQGIAKKTSITLKDMPLSAKKTLKAEYEKLKKNPSKAQLIKLGKKMAPAARKIIMKKVGKKMETVLGLTTKLTPARLKGKGLSLAGKGLGLAGGSAKAFDKKFVKDMTDKLTK